MARTTQIKAAKREAQAAREKETMQDDPFINDDNDEDDIENEDGPPEIDPYHVLGLETEATADDVKKAYRKLALKHHPDKATETDKESANKKFQEIAFAYAVLSDDRRRKRYDLTGSTAEILDDDGDFNWLSFYREQFENVVNDDAINKLSNDYKGSEDERRDLLSAYTKGKGSLVVVYQRVMLSDVLEDDDRFRQILDEEISKGNIESFPAYERETDATRQKAKDAEKKRREDYDKHQATKEGAGSTKGKTSAKAKPKGKKGGVDDMAGLAALIQGRQKARAGGFFDQLEAKYAPTSRGSKRSTPMEEPPEELFEANRAKRPKRSTRTKKTKDEEEDEEMDMGEEDIGDSEEDEAPRKSRTRGKAKGRGRAGAKA